MTTNDGPYTITMPHLGHAETFHEQTYRRPPNRGEALHNVVEAFLRAGHALADERTASRIRGSLLDVA